MIFKDFCPPLKGEAIENQVPFSPDRYREGNLIFNEFILEKAFWPAPLKFDTYFTPSPITSDRLVFVASSSERNSGLN